MIVDIYTHIFPERFFQELERGSPKLGNMGKRLRSVRKLFDLDMRFRRGLEDLATAHLILRCDADDVALAQQRSPGGLAPA